jgi:uncharacterized membrane protein
MSDRSLGSLIFALGLVGAIVYVYWLFGPIPTGWEALFVAPEWMQSIRWAVVIPLVVAVLAVLFIAMWIGWTMAVTPPPTLIDEDIDIE